MKPSNLGFIYDILARSILESKSMRAIFQKRGKKGQKRQNTWKFGQFYIFINSSNW